MFELCGLLALVAFFIAEIVLFFNVTDWEVCREPAYDLLVSPMTWMLIQGCINVSIIVVMIAWYVRDETTPERYRDQGSYPVTAFMLIKIVTGIVTVFILFREPNVECKPTTIYNMLFADFVIWAILAFMVTNAVVIVIIQCIYDARKQRQAAATIPSVSSTAAAASSVEMMTLPVTEASTSTAPSASGDGTPATARVQAAAPAPDLEAGRAATADPPLAERLTT